MDAIKQQKKPNGEGDVVLNKVLEDLEERAEFGKDKYDTYLRIFDDRDTLVDLYQELLDATMYCKKLLMEREDNGTS